MPEYLELDDRPADWARMLYPSQCLQLALELHLNAAVALEQWKVEVMCSDSASMVCAVWVKICLPSELPGEGALFDFDACVSIETQGSRNTTRWSADVGLLECNSQVIGSSELDTTYFCWTDAGGFSVDPHWSSLATIGARLGWTNLDQLEQILRQEGVPRFGIFWDRSAVHRNLAVRYRCRPQNPPG